MVFSLTISIVTLIMKGLCHVKGRDYIKMDFFLKKRSNYILSTGNTPYPKIKSKRMEKYTSYKLTTESRSG